MESIINNLGMHAVAAEIFLMSAICVILLIDVFLSDRTRWVTYALSLISLVACAWITLQYGVDQRELAFDGMFVAAKKGAGVWARPNAAR